MKNGTIKKYPVTDEQLQQFLDLFNPSPPDHFIVADCSNLSSIRTIKRKITLDDLRRHFAGENIVGIHSFVSETEVVHGALDIDHYEGKSHSDGVSFDGAELQKQIDQLNLPLIVSETKSGALRAHLFCSEPAEACLVIQALKVCKKKLNLDERTEIFPKQETLSGGKGNSIFLPYGNGKAAWGYRRI